MALSLSVTPSHRISPGQLQARQGNQRHPDVFLSGNQNAGCAMAVILIVEDEAQVRVLSESFLQEQGHKTLSAATPNEALAVLEDSEEIDCLFTDIDLQGDVQAGLNLAQAAVSRRPDIRVLYTSCHPLTDGMNTLFVESSAFLPKPYTIDQLQTILSVDFAIKPHPISPVPPHLPQASV